MHVAYENSNGQKIDFTCWPIAIKDLTELFGKEWHLEATEKIRANKSTLNKWYRTKIEKTFEVEIYADSAEEYDEIMNRIEEVTEYDIINEKSGKLWVGEYYLPCVVSATDLSDYEEYYYAVNSKVQITALYPFWLKEQYFSFAKAETDNEEDEFLDYPYGYNYDYRGRIAGIGYVNNKHYAGSEFIMRIFGPVVNPTIAINETTYVFYVTLDDGEFLTVDTRDGTVIRSRIDGKTVNEFDKRKKDVPIYTAKLKRGSNLIVWNGAFGIDFTLFEKRSEPRWM